MKIAMIVRNDVERDSRVQKEAMALIAGGHEVRIYGATSERYGAGQNSVSGLEVIHVTEGRPSRNWKWLNFSLVILFSPIWLTVFIFVRILAFGKTNIKLVSKKIEAGYRQYIKRANSLLNSHLAPVRRFRFGRVASEEIIKWGPDAVHVHDLETALGGLQVKRRTGALLVYDSHELWLDRNEPHRDRLSRKIIRVWEANIERTVFKRSSGIVTVAPGILDILLAKYPLDHGNACVVRNIPGDWEPIGEIAKGLKMMDSRRVIAYSGRITTGRNLELLIKTAPELGFPHRLCLLGYGPPVYIQKLVNQAKLCDAQLEIFEAVHPSSVVASLELANIIFVGVENVAKSYELALPNKFFEAILSGKPVVAPNLPEMMKFGKSLPGIFWYEPSSTSLSEALTRAENSMPLPPEMIEVRMEKVRWSSEARQLVDLYESLVSLNS